MNRWNMATKLVQRKTTAREVGRRSRKLTRQPLKAQMVEARGVQLTVGDRSQGTREGGVFRERIIHLRN